MFCLFCGAFAACREGTRAKVSPRSAPAERFDLPEQRKIEKKLKLGIFSKTL